MIQQEPQKPPLSPVIQKPEPEQQQPLHVDSLSSSSSCGDNFEEDSDTYQQPTVQIVNDLVIQPWTNAINPMLDIDDEEEGSTTSASIIPHKMANLPLPAPIITEQYSLKPDMVFGWKPQDIQIAGAPIPLYFDYESYDDGQMPVHPVSGEALQVSYYGPRFRDSLEMHRAFAQSENGGLGYKFKFPPNMNVIEAMLAAGGGRKRTTSDEERGFVGMNPLILQSDHHSPEPDLFRIPSLHFDSNYECGNLDMAVQIKDNEYDLYMRVDSNTRGHHQWFYFTVSTPYHSLKGLKAGRVKFNIVNFTKNASLYHQGMRINVHSQKDNEKNASTPGYIMVNEGWVKGCENIVYKSSKISQARFIPGQGYVYPSNRRYFQVSFEYDFSQYDNDVVTFAYSVPYTFTKLQTLIKQVIKSHQDLYPHETNTGFVKESVLCKSLSGLDVPILTVSSRVQHRNFEFIDESEFATAPHLIPLNKYKKYIIVCARVHPGETNASFIMQGFIKFITSPTNPEAIELRKRIVFKIIPMTNPDGVIVGNYRSSMSGNDLNRQFINPNTKLHPTVCAIKALVASIINNAKEPEPLASFIDIHGHSRKKSIFIYGPHFPLHNERYLKMRVLPKLLSERSEMFRFFSCKFRIQKSKLKAARVVLWKEFNIMNCFTLEASFHGYIDRERRTIELTTEMLENMGQVLGSGFHEYQLLVEEDEKQKLLLKQQIKNKKKKLKAKDITQAYNNKQEQQITAVKSKESQAKKQECAGAVSMVESGFFSQQSDQDENPLTNGPPNNITPSKTEASPDKTEGALASLKHPRTAAMAEITSDVPKSKKSIQSGILTKGQKNFRIKVVSQKVDHLVGYQNSFKGNKQTLGSVLQNRTQIGFIRQPPLPLPLSEKIDKPQQNKLEGTQEVKAKQRTLKEIYRLLKQDVKTTLTQQNVAVANGPNVSSANNQQYESNSSDSDDSGGDDEREDSCCEGGDDLGDGFEGVDDLTPGELEELQKDIIRAIENFDMVYNKAKQTQKAAKPILQKPKLATQNSGTSNRNESFIINGVGQQLPKLMSDKKLDLKPPPMPTFQPVELISRQQQRMVTPMQPPDKKSIPLVQLTISNSKESNSSIVNGQQSFITPNGNKKRVFQAKNEDPANSAFLNRAIQQQQLRKHGKLDSNLKNSLIQRQNDFKQQSTSNLIAGLTAANNMIYGSDCNQIYIMNQSSSQALQKQHNLNSSAYGINSSLLISGTSTNARPPSSSLGFKIQSFILDTTTGENRPSSIASKRTGEEGSSNVRNIMRLKGAAVVGQGNVGSVDSNRIEHRRNDEYSQYLLQDISSFMETQQSVKQQMNEGNQMNSISRTVLYPSHYQLEGGKDPPRTITPIKSLVNESAAFQYQMQTTVKGQSVFNKHSPNMISGIQRSQTKLAGDNMVSGGQSVVMSDSFNAGQLKTMGDEAAKDSFIRGLIVGGSKGRPSAFAREQMSSPNFNLGLQGPLTSMDDEDINGTKTPLKVTANKQASSAPRNNRRDPRPIPQQQTDSKTRTSLKQHPSMPQRLGQQQHPYLENANAYTPNSRMQVLLRNNFTSSFSQQQQQQLKDATFMRRTSIDSNNNRIPVGIKGQSLQRKQELKMRDSINSNKR